MPVEASDIVQTAMNTGDEHSTGCEQAVLGLDERVRKMTERARETELSNQIHNTEVIEQRKPWKSQSTHQLGLQRRPETNGAFSATPGILFWKTSKQNLPAIYIPDARQHCPVPD
jgi:copper oxidase (laccase) domain-containing protein